MPHRLHDHYEDRAFASTDEIFNRTRVSDRGWFWRYAYPPIALITCCLVWEVLSYWDLIDTTVFPPPTQVFRYLWEQDFSVGIGPKQMGLFGAVIASVFRVVAGMFLGVVVAFSLGLLVSVFDLTAKLLVPLIRFVAPIAPVAWLPLAIVLFGLGNNTAVFIVFMGTVFILTLTTVSAVQNVDRRLLEVASTLGGRRWLIWRHVIVPAVLPQMLLSVRINFFAAWMAVLAAEMVGIRNGLGATIMIGRESANFNLILIGMFFIGTIGWCIDSALSIIQQTFFWWRGWAQD